MSMKAGMTMLTATVKRPVPNGRCRVDAATMRVAVRSFALPMLLAAAFNLPAAEQSSKPLAEPVRTVVNQYCVTCRDAEVKKGGLDLERIGRASCRERVSECV